MISDSEKNAELLKRITVRPGQCGGRPCIRGLRVRVFDVLELLASGMTTHEVIQQLPYLEEDDIRASLIYAARAVGSDH